VPQVAHLTRERAAGNPSWVGADEQRSAEQLASNQDQLARKQDQMPQAIKPSRLTLDLTTDF
jgi:hypothetical protein